MRHLPFARLRGSRLDRGDEWISFRTQGKKAVELRDAATFGSANRTYFCEVIFPYAHG